MNLLNVSVVEPIANYDHNAISFKMLYPKSCNNNCGIRYNFYNADFGSFLHYLSSINWDTVYVNHNSTNECWLNFKTVLQKRISIFVP